MPPTGYVPVQCNACTAHRLQLVVPGGVPNCHACGQPATVLPGAAYGADDVELFDRIDVAVRRDVESALVGRRLARELARAAASHEKAESILLRVVDELPNLRFLIPALSVRPTARAERAMMTRAVGMLLTI